MNYLKKILKNPKILESSIKINLDHLRITLIIGAKNLIINLDMKLLPKTLLVDINALNDQNNIVINDQQAFNPETLKEIPFLDRFITNVIKEYLK